MFFSRRRAFANQLDTWEKTEGVGMVLSKVWPINKKNYECSKKTQQTFLTYIFLIVYWDTMKTIKNRRLMPHANIPGAQNVTLLMLRWWKPGCLFWLLPLSPNNIPFPLPDVCLFEIKTIFAPAFSISQRPLDVILGKLFMPDTLQATYDRHCAGALL